MPFDPAHVEILRQDLFLREIYAEAIIQCRNAGLQMGRFMEPVVQRLGLLLL